MRNLHIGPKLTLPPDTVTGTMIVYGGKGMGKSVLAAVVCEELSAAGQRFAVIDPMGVFWGLRHSADGKGPGVEVLILGGKYGDIPIEPTGGRVVADLVADESVDVVIDISRKPDGKMWSRGERIRFVADYCERLYERQGEHRRPLLQIIDECGRFCPEQILIWEIGRSGPSTWSIRFGYVSLRKRSRGNLNETPNPRMTAAQVGSQEFPAGPLDEEERQMLVLALAELALSRPGWDHALRLMAEKFSGGEMYDGFKRTNADRVKAERAPL